MAEKPTAAFVLSLIAGIIALIAGILVLAFTSAIGAAIAIGGAGGLGGLVIAIGVWYFIDAILILLGAFMINSGIHKKVRTGGILVIVFSILSLNLLVIILGLIGGILALTWHPPASMEASAPPASEEEAKEAVV